MQSARGYILIWMCVLMLVTGYVLASLYKSLQNLIIVTYPFTAQATNHIKIARSLLGVQ